MSDLTDVRLLIADRAQVDRAEATGDGATTVFHLPNSPVIAVQETLVNGSSPGVAPVLDADLGSMTFDSAPGNGESVVIRYTHALFTDDEITTFLNLEDNIIRLAAAQALETTASNESLVQKKIRIMDLSTDGPSVARDLRNHAQRLRDSEDASAGFDVANPIYTDAQYRQRIINEALRNS